MQDRRTENGPTSMSYGYSGLTAQTTVPSAGSPSTHGELFVRDPAGDLLAMIDNTTGAANGTTRYYLTDEQKSVMATVADTAPSGGNPVAATRYLYEPYGETVRTWEDPSPGTGNALYTEDAASTPTDDYNPWRFASGYYDGSTGFLKFGTRFYVPQLGTWTQPDPKNGKLATPTTLNSFNYVSGNPCNNTDRSGREIDYSDIAVECAVGAAQDLLLGAAFALFTSPVGALATAVSGCLTSAGVEFLDQYGAERVAYALDAYLTADQARDIAYAIGTALKYA